MNGRLLMTLLLVKIGRVLFLFFKLPIDSVIDKKFEN